MKQLSFWKSMIIVLVLFISSTPMHAEQPDSLEWKIIDKKEYRFYYQPADKQMAEQVNGYLQSGIQNVSAQFNHPFQNRFDVYLFPDRNSLNKQWQKDWNDSTFQSQCWMVASGVAHRLDILSPKAWTKEACDHNANDTVEIRRVIWHELVHVFHGQYNPDHTFSYIEKLDWLVEGVATYISGQLNEKRLQRVKQLITDNKTPATLEDFWKGNEKYGFSGSFVGYIDKAYGRKKLFELLSFTNKQDALKSLGISEIELTDNWKKSFR